MTPTTGSTNYSYMRPGEFWARMYKARDAGHDLADYTLDEFLNLVPLTSEELATAEREADEMADAILARRAARARPGCGVAGRSRVTPHRS